MAINPKGTILVVSDMEPSQLPISKELQALGFPIECFGLGEISSSPIGAAHAIVLVLDKQEEPALGATVARVREVWDAPILLAGCAAASDQLPYLRSDLGLLEIPVDSSGNELEWAVEQACETHSLQSQLEHYRQLIQSAPVGVFEVTDGRLTYVNEYLLQRTGYTMKDLSALPLEELFAPEDRPRLLEAVKKLPTRSSDASPNVYRLLSADGRTFVGEIRSKLLPQAGQLKIEGTLRDITQETHIMQLHRIVLELTEIILAEQDIDKILQLVLDTIVEYGGFRRALLTLYDLSLPVPFDGAVYKTLTSGLTLEEKEAIMAQDPIPVEHRKTIFSEEFKLGAAYYIPHDMKPWSENHGIRGTVAVEGWHPDDFLFIPLRGSEGIIGSISVDDPVDHSVPTAVSIKPVAFLANFAAFAVERVFKLWQMQTHAEQLHRLAALGDEMAKCSNERLLCDIAADGVRSGMDYDACGIYLLDNVRIVHEAVATRDAFPQTDIPEKGSRSVAEGPGITRWVLQNAEPVILPDVDKDPRSDIPRGSVKSYVAVPIIGRKGPIGVIYAVCQHLAAFGDQDQGVLSTVASHLATALSALRRRTALDRVFAFGHHLAVAESEEQAVSSTLEFLVDQFDFQLSSILLVQDAETLRIVGSHRLYTSDGITIGETIRVDEGVIGWVAANHHSANIPDVREDTRYSEAFSGTRSELAVPILFSDNLLGIINIESTQPGFFDDEDGRLIGVIANQLATALSNISAQEDLREQAIRDPLTGLFNRHYFNSIIAAELSRSDRYESPLSLMMVDVDGFRAVNNKLGHLRGDEVLQNVARMLENNIRDCDRAIRYGGDEFLIFMPETDGEGESQLVANRLRSRIGSVLVGTDAHNLGLTLGLSIGIYSRHPGESKTLEEILEEVDRRMYADKRARNEDHADDYRC